MYSTLQPFNQSDLDELLNKRIDILTYFEIKNIDDTHKEWKLQWCQGEVNHVI